MENKELHIKVEQTLNSFNRMERAGVNPFLFTRVMEKMKQPAPHFLKPLAVWQLASSMIIVLGLNITIALYCLNKKTANNQPTESAYFTNHIYNY